MPSISEDDIRRRAFHLWQHAGEPCGSRDTFWYRAEKELLEERARNSKEVDVRSKEVAVRH